MTMNLHLPMRIRSFARPARNLLAGGVTLALAGCTSQAPPSVPIFGSFFPAWIICAVAGVILALISRSILIGLGLDEHLPAPPLVYLSLAVGLSIGLWFLWSGMI